jgi:DNA (cytosine-5)-methyltransferase 1
VRCLELFAGAGGAALGLERAGIHHAALVEWQPSACATLRAAGLSPVVEGDVRDLDAIEAVAGRDVDLVWSSFPCQAWSTAGKRKGANDVRNGWPWTVAALDRFKPRWFLGENVTGLLCHRGGCTYRGGQEGLFAAADPMACPGCYFERVIMPDLRARFACSGWWVIDAADHGTPQHRRRVILWAGPVEPKRPRETHGPGRPLPWVSMGEALGLSAIIYGQPPIRVEHMPSPTVICHWSKDGEKSQQAVRVIDVGNPYLSQPSPTVSAVSECKGSGPGGQPEKMQRASDALFLGTGRRRLTVAECAKLQGFPDDHPWQGAQSSRYRQVGNAVVPRVAELVGRAIIEADRVNP